MSDVQNRYFTNLNEMAPMPTKMEADRVFDVRDPKWAHPILADTWYNPATGGSSILYDPTLPAEQKAAIKDEIVKQTFAALGRADEYGTEMHTTEQSLCEISTFMVPGCPEEPETEAKVIVCRPKTLTSRRARVFFYTLAGALVLNNPEFYPLEDLAVRYNAVLVSVVYRTAIEAPYPAAVNDCHAGYQWVLDNADELGINAKRIVVMGQSSGGHLGLCLGFRLKRYGIYPRGIIAVQPQTGIVAGDSLAGQIYNGVLDAPMQHNFLVSWLGTDYARATIGPEALPNSASVADCIGLPPVFIHTVEFDPDRDNCRELYGKLLDAKVFAEFHCWAGAHHMSDQLIGSVLPGEPNEYSRRFKTILDANIEDCFAYDLRRSWTVEDAKAELLAKLGQ